MDSLDTQISCPSCRRKHPIPAQAKTSICTRCQCELAPLIQIKKAATMEQEKAWQKLKQEEFSLAIELSEHSWTLLHTKGAAECGLLASLCMKDHHSIQKWMSRSELAT